MTFGMLNFRRPKTEVEATQFLKKQTARAQNRDRQCQERCSFLKRRFLYSKIQLTFACHISEL
jgi:hypothetical protein